MSKQPKGELVVVVGFNYERLETEVAEQARSSAERIRQKVKKTLESIIEVGNDLVAVKDALPHGQFGPWLKAEFGWGESMAQNFMAERYKERWNQKELAEMARQLREFADALEKPQPSSKKKTKE